VPGYEQARLFFDQAIEEGCLDTNREHDTDPEVIETILVKFVDQASES
jgi:hypothetical protein